MTQVRPLAVIPYRGTDEWRHGAISTVISWLDAHGVDAVISGSPDTHTIKAKHNLWVDNMPRFQKTRAWMFALKFLFMNQKVEPTTPILLLDADILVESRWLDPEEIRRMFADPRLVGFHPFTQIEDLEKTRTYGVIHGHETFDQLRLAYPDFLRRGRRCYGGAMWLRAGAMAEVGGFDQRFTGWGHEDDVFYYSLRRRYPLGRIIRTDGVIRHLWHAPQNADGYTKGEVYRRNSEFKFEVVIALKYDPDRYLRNLRMVNGIPDKWRLK